MPTIPRGDGGPVHDTLLFYSRTAKYQRHSVFQDYDRVYVNRYFKFDDAYGHVRYWSGDLTGAETRNGPSGQPWKGFAVRAKGRHWAYFPDGLDRLDGKCLG